jgi:succinate-semialdehyde dehydrogenase
MSETVKELVARSRAAQEKFAFATQEQADAAAKAICKVIYDNAEKLGPMAAEDTGMGDPVDKIAKCRNKSALIWYDIKDKKTVGVIERNEELRMLKIAKPMGVVASIIPATNPVVTPMSNAAFALKTRNSIVFSPHPRAIKLTKLIVDMFRAELAKLGLPEDLVLGVENVSIESSAELMGEADVIVATGGMAMVKAAYSSGKPAYGVGQGNVQCIVDDDVDLADAAKMIVEGRAFDCGLICLGEQTAFVPESKFDTFVGEMQKNGAYYISDPEKIAKIRESMFPNHGPINRGIVGKSAMQIAEKLGLDVPTGTRVIMVKVDAIGRNEDLCREKMAPILAVKGYDTFENGMAMLLENLNFEGKGHSICIHSNNAEHVEYAGIMAPVSRVVVNQPSGTTGGGSPTNGFIPTTTLGCGSWGNNSFSGNFTYKLLMNATRVGYPYEKSYLPDVEEAWE